jgi:hypothetical protein
VDHDRQAGMSFERLGSVKTLAVTSRRRSVGHNPLFPILLERKLSAFLEKAVDPGGSGFTDGEGRHTRVYMTRDAKPPLLFRPPGRIRQNLDKLAKRLRSHNRARRN